MTTPDAAARFNLYLVRNFLGTQACSEIIAELSRAPATAAAVYGRGETGGVDERMRKAARPTPSTELFERVSRGLWDALEEVGSHFDMSLRGCEDPQFLRYRVGGFFVAHQGGNTGMLLSEREQSRKISVVIFLNSQSKIPGTGSYGGGSLVFSEWRPGAARGRYCLAGEAGTLVAFPSETTHEVTPVMWGERYSIVSWYG